MSTKANAQHKKKSQHSKHVHQEYERGYHGPNRTAVAVLGIMFFLSMSGISAILIARY